MCNGCMLGVVLFWEWFLGCLGLRCRLRFGFVCIAGDQMVVVENCAHQLRTSFQSLGSMVSEAGVGALVVEVAICLFGFEVGVGFGKRAVAGTCAQRFRSAPLPLIDIPSKLLYFDDLQICLMLAMGLFNRGHLRCKPHCRWTSSMQVPNKSIPQIALLFCI